MLVYICLPPGNVKRHEVFAEFKVLFPQLLHHEPDSNEQLSALRGKVNDVIHSCCDIPEDVGYCLTKKECIEALKSLRSNCDILIT